MKIKFFLVFLASLISAQVSAQQAKCSTASWTDYSCFSPCNELAISALAVGNYGSCVGQATTLQYVLRKFELIYTDATGATRITSQSRTCTIFQGALYLDLGNKYPGVNVSSGSLDFSGCEGGIFNGIKLTFDRVAKISGVVEFPTDGGSQRYAKVTSDFASSQISQATTGTSGWLETSLTYSDDTLNYFRGSAGSTSVFKKIASAPTSSDMSSSTQVTADYDVWRDYQLQVSSADSGCINSWFCVAINSADTSQYSVYLFDGATATFGFFPQTAVGKGDQYDVSLAFYASRRGSDYQGIDFFFRNVGGASTVLGYRPGPTGLQLTFSKSPKR